MLIETYDVEVFTPPCEPGGERFAARAGLRAPIDEVLPYLNATLRGAVYIPVHPFALRMLKEIGIEHSGRSKNVAEMREVSFDLVVSVCEWAAEECPAWLGRGKRVHLGFPDPVEATGSEAEVMAVFRRVRDDIAAKVPSLLGGPLPG